MKFEYKSQPLKQNWNQEFPRYWFDNSPLKTHYLNAFSVMIPIAETVVIHTLKETQKELTDPKLKAQISEMIAQENWHSYSHKKYNDWLVKIGLPADELMADYMHTVIKRKKQWDKKVGKKFWIPVLVSGEHNAVCIMEYFLERPEMLATMHPHFRHAWVWHSIEEIEHKGSSMDMWQATMPLYNRSRNGLKPMQIGAFFTLNYYLLKYTVKLLKTDKQLFKWRTLKDAISFFFGLDGLYTKIIIPYFKCLKSDWHPWQHDSRPLMAQYEKTEDVALGEKMNRSTEEKIDAEFQGCVADIENVIRMNNPDSNIKEY